MFPTPVCKMRGILPTWQQAVGSTWMLVHEGDGESVSRDLRIDQVLERGDRGGGMIDMSRKESVISESVVLGPSLRLSALSAVVIECFAEPPQP